MVCAVSFTIILYHVRLQKSKEQNSPLCFFFFFFEDLNSHHHHEDSNPDSGMIL